jgi:glycosyltransferase involved in cell wall biosynthesis
VKIAYLMHRFPYLTETFVLQELCHIRHHAEEVNIFSLMSPKHLMVHEQAREWLPSTHYSPFLSWSVLGANLHYLRLVPHRYLRALFRLIALTYREPAVMLLSLALFPKSVYFAQEMERLGVEHIHAHFVWLGGLAAGVAAELLGISFTLHAHAFDIFQRNQGNVRREVESATQIITISSYHRAYIAKLCPALDAEQLRIVHLGVDTERFCPAEKREPHGPVRILSIGRLIEKKGHEVLIDACKELAERGVDFHCRIVGDGPLRDKLAKQIARLGLQEQVTLCGALTQDDVLKMHQSSDIFVLPAVVARSGDQDGMPFVLIEAMACGVPVVTTPIAGIPDLVEDGVTGLIVGQRDVTGLAEALQRLAAEGALRLRLGLAARQTVLQEFEIQRNVSKLAAIFREIVHRHKDGRPKVELAVLRT